MVATTLPTPSGITAGTSQRRLKKLGFKQLLTIQRGSSGNGLALLGATEAAIENEEQQDRGLGVDASEVTEHHLQAALSSTQLASEANGSNDGKAAGSSRPAYHIPTPEAKAVLSQSDYSSLYPSGAYSDPVTYVRSSDTVEQSVRGPSYCMDEDDNDWLEERNKKSAEAIAAALRNVKSPVSKGKGREKTKEDLMASLARDNVELKMITAEEFEMVMTVFEQVSADKVPFAHLDLSKLPSLEDLLPSFENDGPLAELALPELPDLAWEQPHSKDGQANGHSHSAASLVWSPNNAYRNLSALHPVAKIIYPFWRERREQREGKPLVPALNFDESNENDPYVCFRRREVKTVRKTRKTDVQHLEKLVRLKYELQQAVTLMTLMAQREKTKRASLMQDRSCWHVTRDFLDVKRQWNIVGPNGGQDDEDLVAADKRDDQLHGVAGAASKKKRKMDDASATAAADAAATANGSIKLSKKARPDDGLLAGQAAASTAGAATASVGLGSAISDRVQAVQAYIERECQRKADGDVGWEEGSDAAFQPMLVPTHLRNFRPIHAETESSSIAPWSNASPSNAGASSSSGTPFLRAGRPASFRKRMGRGGRIFLDRKLPAPSPVPASLSDWPRPDPASNQRPEQHDSLPQQQQQSQLQSSPQQPAAASSRQDSSSQTAAAAPAAAVETSERRAKPWQGVQQAPLTGPFAFSPSIRPSLLNSTSPMIHVHATSHAHWQDGEEKEDDINDVSSPTSSSTIHSRESNATTHVRAASTQPTEAGDMEEEAESKARDTGREDEEQEDNDKNSEIMSDQEDWQDAQVRWSRLQERWRYDDEGGRWAGLGLCGLGGMEDDDEAIIDDFDQRFMRFRMTLLEESDLMKLSTDLTNVMQAQAAADAPPTQPVGYAIYRGEAPSMVHQQQAQQQQAQQQQIQLQVQRQHAQAQVAAAALASGNSMAVSAHLQGPSAMAMPNNLIARAAQTNVGGPLTALQQQQQLHHAQLQMALQQQQARAAAAQAQAQATALLAASSQQQQNQQQISQNGGGTSSGQGSASPIPRPRSGQQMSSMPHPLSQSFGNGGSLPGSSSPVGANNAGRFAPHAGQSGMSPSPFSNGMMAGMPVPSSSPQLQQAHHLAAAHTATSSSPVPGSRSSPHAQQGASFHSSPAQKHSVPMVQGQAPQQRTSGANGNFVMPNSNTALSQMNPLAAAAAMQQAQAVLQQQQNVLQQQANNGAQTATSAQFQQQLMAMQSALQQSSNHNGQIQMQLKLPANRTRALEMAQQAAKVAAAVQQQNQSVPSVTAAPGSGMGLPASQAQQIGMGLLANLQQQMSFAQSQQHNFSALNAASGAPNNAAIMAAVSNNSSSPKPKSRT